MASSSALFSDQNRMNEKLILLNYYIIWYINKFVMEKGKRLISYSAIYLLELKFVYYMYYVHVRVFFSKYVSSWKVECLRKSNQSG